jgi:pyrroline-5-carboxylate reductase
MNIHFIGFGSMAKAIARGLISNPTYHLSASAPSLPIGINQDKIRTHYQNAELVHDAHVVILAVKPNQMFAVLTDVMPKLNPSCLLISIAAGLSLDWFATHLDKPYAVIRTMPNTPAAVGLGATPMIANLNTTLEQKQWAVSIFTMIGLTHYVTKENDMNGFTALSGSGPAYVFLFIEALVKAAVSLGIDRSVAQQFALQTCQGALKLAQESPLSLTELRNQVTSPGGTTAAALSVLHQKLDELILLAMNAAKERADELGQRY